MPSDSCPPPPPDENPDECGKRGQHQHREERDAAKLVLSQVEGEMRHRFRRHPGEPATIKKGIDRGENKIRALRSGGNVKGELRTSDDNEARCLDFDPVILNPAAVCGGRDIQRLSVVDPVFIPHTLRLVGGVFGFPPELLGSLNQGPEADLLLLRGLLLETERLRGPGKKNRRPFEP